MLCSQRCARAFACVLVMAVATGHLHASLIIEGSHTDHSVVWGGLDGVRLAVDMSISGSTAIFTFTNDSVAGETAVFKKIFLDLSDDDTSTAFLWNGSILAGSSSVIYSMSSYNALPGFNPPITDGASMIELEAISPPPHEGMSRGQYLTVQFDTSPGLWPVNADIFDYLALFNGGGDTAEYAIGFHAISATVVGGEGLSGASPIPEPGALAVLTIGAAMMALRRRRRGRAV